MGASVGGGDERIGLLIDTQSNLAGLKAARTETQAYANDVKAVTAAAASAGSGLEISAEQGRAAWAAAGGDYAKFQEILSGVATKQLQVGATATEAGALIVKANESAVASEQALASSTAGAAEAQSTALALVGAAAEKAAAQQDYGSRAAVAAGRSYDAVSPKARSAANAFAILSQVAISGNGSLAGIASSAGLAGQSIAAMATSARVAALASGIGAIITVGAVVVGALMHISEAAKATQAELDHVGNINIHGIDAQLQQANAMRDAAMAKYEQESNGIGDFLPWTDAGKARAEWQTALDYANKVFEKSVQLKAQQAEASRARAIQFRQQFTDQSESLAMQTRIAEMQAQGESGLDHDAAVKKAQNQEELLASERQILAQFTLRDAEGQIIPLTIEQKKQRSDLLQLTKDRVQSLDAEIDRETRLTHAEQDRAANVRLKQGVADANPNDMTAQHDARMAQIEEERAAAVKAGEDPALAEKEAQQKIAAYRKQTALQAIANYQAIGEALMGSNNRAVKAIGLVADTYRRVMIGASGADAAVHAAIEIAAAIGSAASGNFGAAALHAESAAAYGKAAALALTESLGSGGGSGSSGGGSGGSNTTFEPSDKQSSGNQVLVLNTVDPYSGAAINSVAYELNRAGQLKKPVFIPPTAGFAAAGG